jgi:tetratricopeptide (TPR) repeat protein
LVTRSPWNELVHGLLSLAVLLLAPTAASSQGAAVRVLVMPFEADARLPTTYWLGEGTAIALGDALESHGMQVVTHEARTRAFEDLHLPARGALTRATVVRVGQLMGATHVVLGAVSLTDGALRVRARTLSLDAGQYRAEVQEQGPPSSLFALCARVAGAIATREGLGPAATGGPEPADGARLEAFEAYVKGVLAEGPDARRQALERAVQKQPGYDRALLALWDAHTESGDHAAALAAARAVPANSARAGRASFLAALSLVELKRFDDAFGVLRALADVQPVAAVLNNMGVVQLRRGATPQTGRATYYFNEAAERDVDDPDVCFNLGYAYLLERDAVAASYWLREAVRRSAADGDAHYALGLALQASGAAAEGRRELELAGRLSAKFETAKATAPDDAIPRGLERLKPALTSWRSPQIDAALAAADQREQQELTDFYLDRARRAFEQHRDGDALGDLRRVLFLAPYHGDALLLTGRVHRKAGRLQEAIASLRIALWSGESVAGHLALADALLEAQDAPAARAEAQRALEMDPSNAEARALLARIDQAGVR